LQRFYNLNFSMLNEGVGFHVFRVGEQNSFARIAGLMKAAFE
jgi:hypothetical protein